MKKIVHILNTGSYSGAENVVITTITQMKKRYKGQYDCIYMSLYGVIGDRLRDEGIEYYPVKKLSVGNIRKMLKECKPDIIHAHDYTASMICAATYTKIPVICHLHSNPLWLKKINIKSLAYLATAICYKKILLVSSAIEEEYVFGKWIKRKIDKVGNPVDISIIQKKAKECREDRYDIVFLGRLSEPKRPIKFISVISEMVKRGWTGTAIMIGEGEQRQRIQEEIIKSRLERFVIMKGFVENPYPLLKGARLLCVTSEWEGYGLMAVEALALGVPVVTTRVGGLTTIVTNKSGRFCDTIVEFVQEIEKILQNTEYQKRLSDGAVKRAEELNNIDKYIAHIKEIYDAV